MTLNRFQLAELSNARKIVAEPASFSSFEVEEAAELIALLEARDKPAEPLVCPFCKLDPREHRRMNEEADLATLKTVNLLGISLCPIVRATARKGDSGKGERPYETYYRPPTPAEVEAWHSKRSAAMTPAERRKAAEEAQGRLGV